MYTQTNRIMRDYKEIIKECEANGTHLVSCDDDGFCNECGYDETSKDFEEETEEPTVYCPECGWEGTEEELGTTTDLSDENIGHEIGYGECCPECRSEGIQDL